MKRLVFVLLAACSRSKAPPAVENIVVATPSASTAPIVSVAPTPVSPQIAEMNALKPAATFVTLPGVACKMNGQVGPHTGVVPAKHEAPLTAALAKLKKPETKLALYYGDNAAVMAPIGWTCTGMMGSGGEWVRATPPNDTKGPVVDLHVAEGGTSGRFTVRDVGGRIFPKLDAMSRAIEKDWPDIKAPAKYAPITGETMIAADTLARYTSDPNVAGFAKTANDLEPSAIATTGSIRAIPNGDGGDIGAFNLGAIAIRLQGLHVELIAPIKADFEDRTLPTR